LRKSSLGGIAFAAIAISARLPFLISGKIAFDSDEAVEGLMARHVLHGELPAFFWGQAFKGVPEVYASAGAFAVFGPSVFVLKSVTLAFFATYVALNFILLDKITDRWTASVASLLLILCPPALLFWSVDASAEYVLLMLLGTTLLLLLLRWRTHRTPGVLMAIGLVIGIALWVQQLFIFYLAPIGLILVLGTQSWRRREGSVGRPVIAVLVGAAAIYLTLAVVAFITGGFTLTLGSLVLGARAPQKMARIGVGLAAIAAAVQLALNASKIERARFLRTFWPLAAGFLAGYLPVLLYSILVEPAHAPMRNANLGELASAAPNIAGTIVPILAGFKLATTERMPLPAIASLPIVVTLFAYLWSHRRRLLQFARLHPETSTIAADFFPLFVVSVPLIFLVSGAYLDTQSYRYLIPWYAGLCVAGAAGSIALARGNKALASVIAASLLAVYGWEQVVWYRHLRPDRESAEMLDCLQRTGVRGGLADYWVSYKLTFLSNEQIIVVPSNAADRYPKYTEYVRALPADARLDDVTTCR